MASQPRDSRVASRRDDTAAGERERRGEPPRLRGRQARLDVITRMARERQRELQGISGYHIVSEFPHRSRNRIQVGLCIALQESVICNADDGALRYVLLYRDCLGGGS